MLPLLILVFLFFLLLVYLNTADTRHSLLPSPGPTLPILGHFHHLLTGNGTKDPVNRLWDLYKQHSKGGLLRIRAFNLELVHVGDFKLLKEIFNHPDVQGRVNPQIRELIAEQRGMSGAAAWPGLQLPGVIQSIGESWIEQKSLTLKALRGVGLGKAGVEEVIAEELVQFTSFLRTFAGKPFEISSKFSLPLINILWRLASCEQFEYDDPKLIKLLATVTRLFQLSNSPEDKILLAFPWLANFAPMRRLLKRDEYLAGFEALLSMMERSISDHETTLDTSMPRDLIDMVLMQIRSTTDPRSSFFQQKGMTNLANILLDLFLAGGETSATTLAWSIVHMLRHPDVQEKVHAELDNVLGSDRSPKLQDRPNLPYTEATLMEIQRISNIAPSGLAHVVTRDIMVGGKIIPTNTLVFGLFAEILKGSHWTDGDEFRPERFLDDKGKIIRDEHLIPFSIGKRQCLGENLARAELFLFFATIMKQFSFTPEDKDHPPNLDYCPGLTIFPKPFKVVLSCREQ